MKKTKRKLKETKKSKTKSKKKNEMMLVKNIDFQTVIFYK